MLFCSDPISYSLQIKKQRAVYIKLFNHLRNDEYEHKLVAYMYNKYFNRLIKGSFINCVLSHTTC